MTDAKNVKINDIEHVVVTSTMLSKLFGLTTARIRQLENEGILKKVSRGKYPLKENVKKYVNYLKITSEIKDDKNENEKVDYDEEHALLERRKREKIDLELAAMRGTMHFSEDVEKVMNDMLSNFRAKVLALPSRVSPRLMGIAAIADIQEILQSEVLDVLNELSKYNPNDFYNEKYVDVVNEDIKDEEATDS